ncbi:aminotransferase class V-fold PLP-dependent enzyme [Desulfallas sp. Bu1-1]|uniref:aminotransferase class V-fold PLP-dependent enzyme n=1 Tax=Desulfallas sp. Bu1-1 TaxID=2787620 RepID=UPI00189D9E6E|nr:aminotransferase class V-fold PLP-dependent enzyme [Desulfallas sp. Bu1-1]MBF7081856.1 aminotransferase class V-fold PLP-dependent enzyme [Desulfallas sp. Bu1-1]
MNNVAYFDNAATTFPKPEAVYTFMDGFYRECGVNVGRGQHKLAAKASALVEETRSLILNMLHCPNKKVVLTHTATEALNIILRGVPLADKQNVYISPFEHNAVTRVLAHLQEHYDISLHQLAVDKKTLSYDLEEIKDQFSENKPSLIVISHASNVCGLLAPIYEICDMAKGYESITVIDMCQTAGLVDTDLSCDIIDFAVFAGHKTMYGPLGVAGFVTNGRITPAPILYGGTGVDSANQSLPETIPERYEVASPNIMAIAGLNAAIKWLNETGIDNVFQREKKNHETLLSILQQYSNVKIIGGGRVDGMIGVVSCVFDGYSSDDVGRVLSNCNVAVRTGLHCAPFAHRFLGTFPAGTVRFSVSYFNNEEDFTKLDHALSLIAEG